MKFCLIVIGIITGISTSYAFEMKAKPHFEGHCGESNEVFINFVGDILLHDQLQKRAVKDTSFLALFESYRPFIDYVDYSYANLEGVTARGINKRFREVRDPGFVYDNNVYSEYPKFNYHPSLIDDLKNAGFDLLSTANNHSLDRGPLGIDKTIANLNNADMAFVGTRRKSDRGSNSKWVKNVTIKGIKFSFVSCTFSTNRVEDSHQQVLMCYKNSHKKIIKNIIKEKSKTSDAVVLFPHWGKQYEIMPRQRQINWAHEMAAEGASAIIGNHSHVLGPIEQVRNSKGQNTFIIYSLGNFISGQEDFIKRVGSSLHLNFVKTSSGVEVNEAYILPFVMNSVGELDNVRLSLLAESSENTEAMGLVSSVFHESLVVVDLKELKQKRKLRCL